MTDVLSPSTCTALSTHPSRCLCERGGGALLLCFSTCFYANSMPTLCGRINSTLLPCMPTHASEEDMEDAKQRAAAAATAEEEAASVSLKELSRKLDEFARERDWEQHHNPRNLLLAMVGEVGELAEIFMWRGEVARGLPHWKESEKEHVGEELADVLLYLIRLSDVCGIDLGDAARKKMVKNAMKYPATAPEPLT